MNFAYDEPGTPRGSAAETSTDYVNWRDDAVCKGEDTETFFDPKTYGIAAAFCSRCPVREACLEDAYETNEYLSYRGGMSPRSREDVARGRHVARRCGICSSTFTVPIRSVQRYCGTKCQGKAKAQAQARFRKALLPSERAPRLQYEGEDDAIVHGVLGVLHLLRDRR